MKATFKEIARLALFGLAAALLLQIIAHVNNEWFENPPNDFEASQVKGLDL